MAVRFAPTLNNIYYVGFSSFLIFYGILYSWFVVKRISDPVLAGLIRIRTVLAELRQTATKKERPQNRPEEPDRIVDPTAG